MQLIGARRDDWVPRNPAIRVGGWFAAFVAAAALYVATAAMIGHFISGNGAPFLS